MNEIYYIFLTLIRISLYFSFTIMVTKEYRNKRYPSLIFLISFFITLIISELLLYFSSILLITDNMFNKNGLIHEFIFTSFFNISFFILILFFESFENYNLSNKKTLFLGSLIIAISPLGLITGYLLPDNINFDVIVQILMNKSPIIGINKGSSIIWIFTLSLSLNIFIGLVESLLLIRILYLNSIRTSNEGIKSSFRFMSKFSVKTFIIVIISPVIGVELSLTLLSIFVVIMFYTYFKSGFFIPQGSSLKQLLIIRNDGIPVYSYSFNQHNSYKQNLSQNDILFSGAFKAISTIISEFTNNFNNDEQNLEEISLSDTKLIIKSIGKYSYVLIVTQKTKFLLEALQNFINGLNSDLMIKSNKIQFTNKTRIFMNSILEKSFGIPSKS